MVLILPYDGDMDDRVLEEMKPRFVVMYEPNPAFIRRVEVFIFLIFANPGLSSIPSNATSQSLFFILRQFRRRTTILYQLYEKRKMHLLD